MSDLRKLQDRIVQLRNDRDWQQFHTPKDMAISLPLEASEVLELFQWKSHEEIEQYLKTHKQDLSDELADVLAYLLLIANDLDIDLPQAFEKKMQKNEAKYPVAKAKGKHTKYTEL